MPIYKVVEIRSYENIITINAKDEESAQQLEGDILSEDIAGDWAERMASCEQIKEKS